jgi:hypothetical protein
MKYALHALICTMICTDPDGVDMPVAVQTGAVVLITGITVVMPTQAVITADGAGATTAAVTGVGQIRTITADGTGATTIVVTGVTEAITMITTIAATGMVDVQKIVATITGVASVLPITGDIKQKKLIDQQINIQFLQYIIIKRSPLWGDFFMGFNKDCVKLTRFSFFYRYS